MAVNAILLNEQLLLAIEGSASIPPIRSSGLRLRLNYATEDALAPLSIRFAVAPVVVTVRLVLLPPFGADALAPLTI